MSKELKRVTAMIAGIVALLVAALAGFNAYYLRSVTTGMRTEFSARLSGLEGSMNVVGAETQRVVREENSILAGYSCELQGLNKEEQQVTYVLRATPRVYQEGMSLSFLYTADGQAQRRAVGMREGPGYDYSTVLVLPAGTGAMEVYVALEKDGVVNTQLAETYRELNGAYQLVFHESDLTGSWSYKDGSVKLDAQASLLFAPYAPPERNVGIAAAGVRVHLVDGDGVGETVEGGTDFYEANRRGVWEQTLFGSYELAPGQTLSVSAELTDTNGFQYSVPIASFVLDENGALQVHK